MDKPRHASRRRFLAWLTGGAASLAVPAVRATKPSRTITIQRSPLAGFQYHHGESLWPRLQEGDALDLIREPDNRHDDRAVRVEWQGHKLGYVPRRENTAVAQMLDRGQWLEARIASREVSQNPWDRIVISIHLQI